MTSIQLYLANPMHQQVHVQTDGFWCEWAYFRQKEPGAFLGVLLKAIPRWLADRDTGLLKLQEP
jgi:hypothetical protein